MRNLRLIVRDDDTGKTMYEEKAECIFFGVLDKENDTACGVIGSADSFDLGMLLSNCIKTIAKVYEENPEAKEVCKLVSAIEKISGKKMYRTEERDMLKEGEKADA